MTSVCTGGVAVGVVAGVLAALLRGVRLDRLRLPAHERPTRRATRRAPARPALGPVARLGRIETYDAEHIALTQLRQTRSSPSTRSWRAQ
jgi:hypothetical protein